MSNPFASWTKTQADAHNARVAKQSAKEVGKTVLPTQPDVGHMHRVCRPDESEQFAVTTGARASVPNTRQFTNLIPQPSTDEQKLNKTERAYLAHLRCLNVPLLRIQKITLKLADDCRLTADFTYVDANGREVYVDVKGFQREDALIKMKVAAHQFPERRFVIVKRANVGWEETEVRP